MAKRKYSNLKPGDALLRGSSAPKIVVIGPSSAGKSTLIYLLVNKKIICFLSIGIGDKSQTTIIPCEFVFDERIAKEEHFAIRVKKKVFAKKEIHIVILDELAKLYNANACDPDDTYDALDEEWLELVLEPNSATYHLKKMTDVIAYDDLRNALYEILKAIDGDEFSSLVKEKKKELQGQKIKISDIRYMVFEQMWDNLDEGIKEPYEKWLSYLEERITNELISIIGKDAFDNGDVLQLSTEMEDEYDYGAQILSDLFDPFTPYGLIVDEIVLASRPRMEMLVLSNNASQDQPLRFCARDTMGITQISTEPAEIRSALDSALNCKPDSILFLLSLEERDDVIKESCDALAEKLDKSNRLDIPVYLLFTKPDKILENKINKRNTNGIELSQNEYDMYIMDAISSMEKNIRRYVEKINGEKVKSDWTSLRFRAEEIDPIQKSLHNEEVVNNFKPGGLFSKMSSIIGNTLKSILPKGMDKPLFVSAKNANEPALSIKVDPGSIRSITESLAQALTMDKAIVNGYLISDKTPRLSGRSVAAYWRNLKVGLGHKTRAYVYGNFSINMKGMLVREISKVIPDIKALYDLGAISTIADNLSDEDLEALTKSLDEDGTTKDRALAEVNPALINGWTERTKNIQTLHLIFREYFNDTYRWMSVIDKLAFQLSYGNNDVKKLLETIYYSPNSYDSNMREMQAAFKASVFDKMLENILVSEIGAIMTDQINKMFITI